MSGLLPIVVGFVSGTAAGAVGYTVVGFWTLLVPLAIAYGVCSIFGPGALGPVLVALCGVSLLLAIFGRRAARLSAPSSSLPATTAGAEAG